MKDHRRTRRDRIRWRRFDRDANGSLSREELEELVAWATKNPGHVLVASRDELNPSTHPSFRARLLMIAEA